MRRWLKWTLLATLVAVPALGYAVTKAAADPTCPVNCPCHDR